jgi:hypothetical protein
MTNDISGDNCDSVEMTLVTRNGRCRTIWQGLRARGGVDLEMYDLSAGLDLDFKSQQ